MTTAYRTVLDLKQHCEICGTTTCYPMVDQLLKLSQANLSTEYFMPHSTALSTKQNCIFYNKGCKNFSSTIENELSTLYDNFRKLRCPFWK